MATEAHHYIDLQHHEAFSSAHLRTKNLLMVPSQGESNTQILAGIDGEMWYEQRQAGQVTHQNPGIFVSRAGLPAAEAGYRQQVFGDMNPKWLSPVDPAPGVPLDQLLVANPAFLAHLQQEMDRHFGANKPTLYGFNETPYMQDIANKLAIPYYGNAEFANWAGTKDGLQEFCQECDVPTPLTVAIRAKSEITDAIEAISGAGYEDLVVKVNHSTGGMGHLKLSIADVPGILREKGIDGLFPEEYRAEEGGVVQGWIPGAISASLATFVDFDGSTVFEGAQAHVIDEGQNAFGAIGATPITAEYLNPMLEVGRKIAAGYSRHHAWGSHTMGMLFIPPEASRKLGLPEGVPLCNDENTRCGASTISKAWIQALREERYGVGWMVSKIPVADGTHIAQVIDRLDEKGLLIRQANRNANGAFVFNGAVLDSGYEKKFYAITVSGKDDPMEARALMAQAVLAFN